MGRVRVKPAPRPRPRAGARGEPGPRSADARPRHPGWKSHCRDPRERPHVSHRLSTETARTPHRLGPCGGAVSKSSKFGPSPCRLPGERGWYVWTPHAVYRYCTHPSPDISRTACLYHYLLLSYPSPKCPASRLSRRRRAARAARPTRAPAVTASSSRAPARRSPPARRTRAHTTGAVPG